MACSSAYIFLARWRSLLSLAILRLSTLAIEGRPSLSTLDTRPDSFFTLSRLWSTSSLASSDFHAWVAASPPGGEFGSDQAESSDTEMVGFLQRGNKSELLWRTYISFQVFLRGEAGRFSGEGGAGGASSWTL